MNVNSGINKIYKFLAKFQKTKKNNLNIKSR